MNASEAGYSFSPLHSCVCVCMSVQKLKSYGYRNYCTLVEIYVMVNLTIAEILVAFDLEFLCLELFSYICVKQASGQCDRQCDFANFK